MPLRRAPVAALLLLVLLPVRPAAACSCVTSSEPRDPDVRLLGGEQPLPTNARIRLVYEGGAVRSDDRKTLLPAAAITHVVRTASGAAVAVEPHVIKTSVEAYVELVPHKPLAPRTRYEVVLTHAGEKEYLVGRFLTAAALDRTAPVFAGVQRAVLRQVGGGECTIGPLLNIFLTPATDTGKAPPYYAVWTAPADGAIDYGAAPAAYRYQSGGVLQLHNGYKCSGRSGGLNTFALMGTPGVRVGVVAIDAAGNRSAAREAVVQAEPPASGVVPY